MFTLCVAALPTAPSYSAKDILEAFAKGQRAGQKGRSDAAFDFEGEARRAHVRAHPEDRTLEEQLARVKEELHQVTTAAAGLQRENAELRLQGGTGATAAVPAQRGDLSREAADVAPCAAGWTRFAATGTREEQFAQLRSGAGPEVASMAELFSVHSCTLGAAELSPRGWAAGVTFLVQRRQGCLSHGTPSPTLSRSPDVVRRLKRLGPDELLWMLEGPELAPCTVEHVGDCAYLVQCRLGRPGRYHIAAMHLRSNYDAVNEAIKGWPPGQYDFPLGDHAFYDAATPTPRTAALTECDGTAAWPRGDRHVCNGRWVATSDRPLLAAPTMNVSHEQFPMRPLWVLRDEYAWQPYGCRLPKLDSADAVAELLASAGISDVYFYGDSQAALLFHMFTEGLKWPSGSVQTYSRQYWFSRFRTQPLNGVTLHRYTGQFGQAMYCPQPRNATRWAGTWKRCTGGAAGNNSLVISMWGLHQLSGRVPVATYAEEVGAWTRRAAAWRREGRNRHVYWLPNPTMPPSVDGFVRGHGDGKSSHGAALYNQVAREALARESVPSIDHIAIDHAYTLLQDDTAHFTAPPIFKVQPLVVLAQIRDLLRVAGNIPRQALRSRARMFAVDGVLV